MIQTRLFNELNTVEHFIIHRLTGVNLNTVHGGIVAEERVGYDVAKEAASIRMAASIFGK